MNKIIAKVSKVARILAEYNPALLSTIGINGAPRSRYVGGFRIRDTGEILLISPSNTNKMLEIQRNPKAQVLLSSKDCRRVLTLSGNASIVQNISLRRAFYEETRPLRMYSTFNDYFGVIHFIPFRAEYLDLNVSNDPFVINIQDNQPETK